MAMITAMAGRYIQRPLIRALLKVKQLLYHIDGKDVDAPKHAGTHHSPRMSVVHFEPNEFIRSVAASISTWAVMSRQE